uniref:Uncharacterized protein n=1 Tax=Arundo donax TaxID=35708 RepID=A0A0A9AF99_ARUDO
MDLPKTQGR